MAGQVRYDLDDDVAILSLEGGQGNALSPELREGLLAALDRAEAEPGVRGVVLIGAGVGFSAGLDLEEYDHPIAAPTPDTLCARIEGFSKPVVAALHGPVLGAGAAVALAAHARVAAPSARLLFPEIRLALLPSGGATQRLSRLTGAETALAMFLAAEPATPETPSGRALFARAEGADVRKAAIALARAMARAGKWPPSGAETRGLSDPAAFLKAIAAARAAHPAGVATAVVQCVEAALLLPFERGLELEQCLGDEFRHSDRSRAARHAAIVERAATRLPGLPAPQGQVTDLVLSGRDGPFVELAQLGLDAGWRVHLDPVDPNQEGRVRARIVQLLDGAVARGRMEPAERDARLARLVPWDADRPEGHLRLDLGGGRPAQAGAIDVALMQQDAAPDGPSPLWLRLPSGARLAEVALAQGADPAEAAVLAQALARGGRAVIRAAPVAGMIGGNLDWALRRAALRLAEAGQDAAAIDAAAAEMGLGAGPLAQMDEAGLGAVLAWADALAAARGAPPEPAEGALHRLVAAGHAGQAAGRGFYRYRDGAASGSGWPATATPMTRAMLALALHAALVNEGARLLHDGVALRPGDVDVAAVRGMGYQRSRGGPLFAADLQGIFPLSQAMGALMALDDALWRPHPLIEEMVRNGEGFFGRPD